MLIFGLDAWVFWLILLVFFLIAEAVTLDMVTIWFAFGSLIATVLAVVGAPVFLQAIVMAFLSVGSLLLYLLLLKPKMKLRESETTKQDLKPERLIGVDGSVIETIEKAKRTGLVKVKGQVWGATSKEPLIHVGSRIEVVDTKGIQLVVCAKKRRSLLHIFSRSKDNKKSR